MESTRTISGFLLKKKDYKVDLCNLLEKEFLLNGLISKIISSRIENKEDLKKFLDPKLKYNLKNPENLKDLKQASDLLRRHIDQNSRILIFGDYDVDGSTSSAILVSFFKEIGYKNFDVYIPNRFKEGYGLSLNAILNINFDQFDLLITLDCGTSSLKEIELIRSKKVDVIVIDHHKSKEIMPDALVVNANRFDESENEFKTISAAGVLFLFLCYFVKQNNYKVDLIQYLDLVALSTVCDVMPLTGINRSFVSTGLQIMNSKRRKCFKALSEILEIKNYTSYELGFKIGPMINAGGRLNDSTLGMRMLISDDEIEITELIKNLSTLNQERSCIESTIIDEIKLMDEDIKRQINEFGFIFLFNEKWHEGVIGIIASRIKDIYHRPAIIGFEKNSVVKCSCRSIASIDIGMAILDTEISKFLINGGGHKMAGGISFKKENYQILQSLFSEKIKKLADEFQISKEIFYDSDVIISSLHLEFARSIKVLEPFGNGNEKPLFKINNIIILDYQILKDKHIKIKIKDENGYMEGIAFNVCGSKLGNLLISEKKCDLIVNLSVSEYLGREKVSFQILDAVKLV